MAAWNDGWESIADREAVEAKSEVVQTVEGSGSSSGSSTTSNSSSLAMQSTGPKILAKKVLAEEENRKIWEDANATTAFELEPSSGSANTKIVNFKPELKILKRAPPANTAPKTVNPNADSPAILDRKEKERRYAEARERLFGPTSSTTSNESTPSVATTPTVGMSRSSSSSGLVNKNVETVSGTTTPSRERAGGARGGKKTGRGNSNGNSGNNTPRSRSPGRGQRGSDPNRTSGIVGGITKVTENGWVYTGTGPTSSSRTSSPASIKPTNGDSRVGSPGIAAVPVGVMSMNINPLSGYNHTTNPYANTSGAPNPWGMGVLGGGAVTVGQRPHGGFVPSGQGYPSQQYYTQSQQYPMAQPPQQFPQYSGPPGGFNPQAQSYQQQQQPQANNFSSYQTSGAPGPYNIPHQQHAPLQQQHTMSQAHLNYQRPFSQTSTGLSPLSSTLNQVPRHEPTGGSSRTVYLQDPNAYAARPPPPQGNLLPGFGNHPNGDGDPLNPIRAPRGPDMNTGRGFSGRGGRGGGFGAS